MTFEQIFLARVTGIVQERGNFWGGKDAVPARECSWSRAAALLPPDQAADLASAGIVIIDGALTAAEAAAARAEVDAHDAQGVLKEVAAQAKARIRNDRIGWLSSASMISSLVGSPKMYEYTSVIV